ncbi:MAG TPA: hypothetical protein VFA24_07490 [Gaiellaceae bacterium]|nr:hypothetical protein [Gaiellaceae bacterium]
MEHSLHRYFVGLVAFAAVVTAWTVGLVAAVVALLACAAAVYLGSARKPRARQAPRTRVRARALAEEDESHPLVPDDPSLILSTY